jgi:GMP synthase (glutamine-hydrolysing)
LGLSGGVDSSVTAALLHKAIGNKLICVFVDNGLLRKGEAEEVMNIFKENMNLNVIKSDSEEVFLRHLKGIADPEQKRKIIGRTFIDVFDAEATKLKDVYFLAQGTIYPDVIESSGSESKEARVIKSHHNVGGLPEEMKMELVEPLRDLFKDEVRRMGVELGLSSEMLNRHPFPGPGLGVRILGEITKKKTSVLKEADQIFIEELIKADLYKTVSQAFAVYLPIKSVGVVGDERRYAEVIALRAVETVDFMTARWAHLPYEFLEHVSNRIVNEIQDVSRVVYDISSKPPATIEWE